MNSNPVKDCSTGIMPTPESGAELSMGIAQPDGVTLLVDSAVCVC